MKDPIERVRVYLIKQQWADQDFFDSIQAEADTLAHDIREYCVTMSTPPVGRIFSKVYAETNPVLDAQRDEFMAYHAGFVEGDH